MAYIRVPREIYYAFMNILYIMKNTTDFHEFHHLCGDNEMYNDILNCLLCNSFFEELHHNVNLYLNQDLQNFNIINLINFDTLIVHNTNIPPEFEIGWYFVHNWIQVITSGDFPKYNNKLKNSIICLKSCREFMTKYFIN